ncbi:hypothetical protein GUJ93_ZPchr0010g7476 [Zizania palustris]|uniref:Uncharacterized protein n=1 Tax=Zizania palustris TaxID=103762 RepID=A0A8J5TGQ9_ZIZPA|nr:hypothetical protein GUJ93_ZPchr0010g7476 [Zizania palustris]
MKRSNAMSSTIACSASQPVLSGDVIIVDDIPEPPSSKRKLNFGNEPDGACDVLSSTLSALVDNADSDEGLAQAFEDIAANQGLDSIIDIPTNDFYIAGPAAYQVNSQDTFDIMAKSTSEAELENVSARLPSLVPVVDKAKELLLQLISVSQQLQLAHAEFESYSAQKRKSLMKQNEEKAQFSHRPSEREANGKKWNEAIVESAAGVEQAASNLQVKVTSCEQNVDGLLKSLKTWSATTN